MKQLLLAVFLLGISGGLAKAEPPAPQDVTTGTSASFGDADFFYQSLSPFGEWIELDAGFYAWRPTHVRFGWRPYLHGHWEWTDYGWYWVSSEPFGWAVFHYGRWYDDDTYGWIWIPNRTWGPAWVEWRYNDDYLGWAPLPPYASFSLNVGIRFTTHWSAPHRYWNFVRYRYLTSPNLYREVVTTEYSRRLIGTTRSAGRYDVENGRIIDRGVDRSIVERRGGYTRIDRMDVRESSNAGERIVRDRNQTRIEVFRPERSGTGRAPERFEALHPSRGTSLDLQRIERPGRDGATGSNPVEVNRSSGATRGVEGNPQGRVQPDNVPRSRSGATQRAPDNRQVELPQNPTLERREIERRRDDRYPFPQRQEARPQQDQKSVTPKQRDRREVSPQRMNQEQARPAQEIKRENPRGSETIRRDGGRRRD